MGTISCIIPHPGGRTGGQPEGSPEAAMEGAGDSRHRQPGLEEDGESYAQGQGFGIRWME